MRFPPYGAFKSRMTQAPWRCVVYRQTAKSNKSRTLLCLGNVFLMELTLRGAIILPKGVNHPLTCFTSLLFMRRLCHMITVYPTLQSNRAKLAVPVCNLRGVFPTYILHCNLTELSLLYLCAIYEASFPHIAYTAMKSKSKRAKVALPVCISCGVFSTQ
jgi:hypothetical protein